MISTGKEKEFLLQFARDYVEGKEQPLTWTKYWEDVDWQTLHDLALEQKLFPLVYAALRHHIPPSWKTLYQDTSHSILLMNRLIYDEITALSRLQDEDMIFIKGVVLSQLLYNDPFVRISGDIDTLIREANLQRIHALLQQEGFFPACGKDNIYDPDYGDFEVLPYPILKDDLHHEYFEYYKSSGADHVTLELQRYIHGSITSAGIDRFLNGTRVLPMQDSMIRTLDTNHTLLYLIESVHTDANWYHRGPKLNKYLELGLFIRKYANDFDWEGLLSKADEFQMIDIVHDIWMDLQELFPSLALPEIAEPYKSFKRYTTLPINWDTPLVERLFQSYEERSREIFRSLKMNCYSMNALEQAIKLTGDQDDHVNGCSRGPLLTVPHRKNSYHLNYRLSSESDNLIFTFYFPDEMLLSSSDWEVFLNTIDPCLDSGILDRHTFTMAKLEGSISLQAYDSGDIDWVSDYEIKVRIPLSDFGSSSDQQAIAYKIIIREHIYGPIYHSMSPDGYMDKSFWLHPTIVQVLHKERCK